MKKINRREHHQEVVVSNLSNLPVPIPCHHVLQFLFENAEVELPWLRGENGCVRDPSIHRSVCLGFFVKLETEKTFTRNGTAHNLQLMFVAARRSVSRRMSLFLT